MPGPKPRYTIQLLEDEESELRQLVRSRKAPRGKVMRAKIVLAAHDHPEWSHQQMAREVGCSDRVVRTWRRRWVESQGLEDRPRPGAPRRFPPEVRAQATALACRLPQEQGATLSRWSWAEIAAQLVALGVVAGIAASTIGRWLAADQLKPWRYRSWQHILDPQAFLERARPVLRWYERAKELLKQGLWVVCVDEKTSIQARQGEQAPQPAQPGEALPVSPRYQRQGALQLLAALSVADGCKYGPTFERKRFVDFQAFLRQTLVPEALRRGVQTVKLILDGGSHPCPEATGGLAAGADPGPWLAPDHRSGLVAHEGFVAESD